MKNKLRIALLLLCLCPMTHLLGQNTLSTLENMHYVGKGETWETIAAKHGVSVLDLQAANPDIKINKLKKGILLIVPSPSPKTESLPPQKEEHRFIRTANHDMKVGVLLPFSDAKMVEFYRGLLMAADSVRKAGANFEIFTWDCGTTSAQIEPLLPKLGKLDVLFGPVSDTQIPAVAEVCKEQGTRLVLPFSSDLALQEYPLVYAATAPNQIVFDAAAKKLTSYFSDRRFVIVYGNNADTRGKMLSEMLKQSLIQRTTIAPKVLELEGDEAAYISAFSMSQNNMVLLDDCSIRSLNILLARLKDFRQKHPEYRLSLIGYPEWQSETQRLLNDYFTFDTYILSPYYYNVLDSKNKRFQHTYEKFFRTPVAQNNPRLAAMGFDLGYYFLSGISSLGDTFEQMQGSLHQEPFQNRFDFKRSTSGMSFYNHFVQFIHFTPDNKIELIR